MTTHQCDTLLVNANIATCESPVALIKNAAIATQNGKIAWLGKMEDLPKNIDSNATKIIDCQNKWITPGLIDCHTHIVYGGNRFHEFALRARGATYAQIAQAGGGIQSTVSMTRQLSEEELLQQSLARANYLSAEGVSVLEIKSGYGLDLTTELKILRVAKRLEELLPLTVRLTFLGAHALPLEYKNKPDDYVDLVCQQMLPAIVKEGLAHAVDVFCENIAFNLEQTEKVFKTAKEYGLAVKGHIGQLSDLGGATLAAKYQALSVDHVEYISENQIAALAESKTVAVLLPGAFYFLKEKQKPPIDLFRQYNVPMAIATDCNPGTSPITSLLLMLNMSCILFGLTPSEALLGVTQYAAKALGISETHGTLTVGKVADFAIWSINHPDDLAYQIGANPLQSLVKNGSPVLME